MLFIKLCKCAYYIPPHHQNIEPETNPVMEALSGNIHVTRSMSDYQNQRDYTMLPGAVRRSPGGLKIDRTINMTLEGRPLDLKMSYTLSFVCVPYPDSFAYVFDDLFNTRLETVVFHLWDDYFICHLKSLHLGRHGTPEVTGEYAISLKHPLTLCGVKIEVLHSLICTISKGDHSVVHPHSVYVTPKPGLFKIVLNSFRCIVKEYANREIFYNNFGRDRVFFPADAHEDSYVEESTVRWKMNLTFGAQGECTWYQKTIKASESTVMSDLGLICHVPIQESVREEESRSSPETPDSRNKKRKHLRYRLPDNKKQRQTQCTLMVTTESTTTQYESEPSTSSQQHLETSSRYREELEESTSTSSSSDSQDESPSNRDRTGQNQTNQEVDSAVEDSTSSLQDMSLTDQDFEEIEGAGTDEDDIN